MWGSLPSERFPSSSSPETLLEDIAFSSWVFSWVGWRNWKTYPKKCVGRFARCFNVPGSVFAILVTKNYEFFMEFWQACSAYQSHFLYPVGNHTALACGSPLPDTEALTNREFSLWKTHDIFRNTITTWWFQPVWKIIVKWHHFPKLGVKNKNIWNHLEIKITFSFFILKKKYMALFSFMLPPPPVPLGIKYQSLPTQHPPTTSHWVV